MQRLTRQPDWNPVQKENLKYFSLSPIKSGGFCAFIPLAHFAPPMQPLDLMGFLFLVKMEEKTYTKYKAVIGLVSITQIEVIGETEKFVTLKNGQRQMKVSDNVVYCDTHEDAVRTIYDHLLNKVEVAKNVLTYHEERLNYFAGKHNL